MVDKPFLDDGPGLFQVVEDLAVEQLIAAVSGFAEEGMLAAHDEAYSLLLSPCAPGSSSKATPLTQ